MQCLPPLRTTIIRRVAPAAAFVRTAIKRFFESVSCSPSILAGCLRRSGEDGLSEVDGLLK